MADSAVSTALVTPDGDRLLTIHPDVTAVLNCDRSTVYMHMSRGLPSVKLGRRRYVRHSDLQAFIAGLTADGGE